MADEKDRGEWKKFSHLMAVVANANRAEGQKPARPEDFDQSSRQKKRAPVRKGDIGELKAFLPTKLQNETAG